MYPPDFVYRAKVLFPTSGTFHSMLDRGDPAIGSVLRTYCPLGDPSAGTLRDVAQHPENKMCLTASRILRILALYEEWELLRTIPGL